MLLALTPPADSLRRRQVGADNQAWAGGWPTAYGVGVGLVC
ncbi:MAG: hypothetical protein V9F04_12350 [Dermatophilaceae bacterium]